MSYRNSTVFALALAMGLIAPGALSPESAFLHARTPAAADRSDAKVELYSDRPQITDVTPTDHASDRAGFPENWGALRDGGVAFAAQILGLYGSDPHMVIVDLARDAELDYDRQILLKELAGTRARIELANISRSTKNDPHLLDYLASKSITREALEKGLKVVFIDTGYEGSIPKAVRALFPGFESSFAVHLMVSDAAWIPSSRVFLRHLSPKAHLLDPRALHSAVLAYELIARFASRATHYLGPANGGPDRWEAASTGSADDGEVDRVMARKYMEDVAYHLSLPETRARFKAQFDLWSELGGLARSGQMESLKAKLQELTRDGDAEGIAIAKDLVEWGQRNRVEGFTLELADLGIAPDRRIEGVFSKTEFKSENPELAWIVETPVEAVNKVFAERDLTLLGLIIDVIHEPELQMILANRAVEAVLYENADRRRLGESILTAMAGKPTQSPMLAQALFGASGPSSVHREALQTEVIKALRKAGNRGALSRLEELGVIAPCPGLFAAAP